jgi:hypothetical protein
MGTTRNLFEVLNSSFRNISNIFHRPKSFPAYKRYNDIDLLLQRQRNALYKGVFDILFQNMEHLTHTLEVEKSGVCIKNSQNEPRESELNEKSLISDGGNGVFLRGSVNPFTVIALYPGVYLPPPPVHSILGSDGDLGCYKPSEQMRMFELNGFELEKENRYRIHCSNIGGYLNTKSPYHKDYYDYIVGHIVNHPNLGVFPNVAPFSFKWRDIYNFSIKSANFSSNEFAGVWEEKVRKINNFDEGIWYIDSNDFRPHYISSANFHIFECGGLALVSICPIHDKEELFMDYRYNEKDQKLPDWYHPVKY